ncbi:SRPBCC family protein [Streptantibioticus ferralitis]|uniref:SRPBCC family protein n=1 Tax=Streptantibioticus ferralitis TaxID=236510 RepID=A0ABT5YWK7_9ACTN|nr:SRPBCC family protein [Streptantibioticus ferralitis]MDF2255940.1 SRPBCC family protein [Streptantibioticus ferralitis]
METVTVRRVIAAPIADVFDWCATTTNYTRSPFVLRARLARPGAGAPYGVGAVRLHTWLIGWFRERITVYNPPHDFDYVVERSLPPARHELGRMTFTEVAEGTQVVWTTTFQVPFPFGEAATRVLVGPVIAHVFGKILHAADTALTANPASHT